MWRIQWPAPVFRPSMQALLIVVALIVVQLCMARGGMLLRGAKQMRSSGLGYVIESGLAGCGWLFVGVFLFVALIGSPREHPTNPVGPCIRNSRSVWQAIRLYAEDNDDHFPLASSWCDGVKRFVHEDQLSCPAIRSSAFGYGMNINLSGRQMGNIYNKPNLVFTFDANGDKNASGGLADVAFRHPGSTAIITFADGNIKPIAAHAIWSCDWTYGN